MALPSTILTASGEQTGVTSAARTRIFILANPDIYVDGLRHVLDKSSTNEVAACVKPGDSCWEQFVKIPADILLVHRSAVQAPCAAFFKRFKDHSPNLRIVVFGQPASEADVFAFVRAGANGWVTDRMTAEDLLEAIDEVKAGRLALERPLLAVLAQEAIEMESLIEEIIREKIESLGKIMSKRETAVLQLVLQGLSTKEMADSMHISEQSIKLHLTHLFKKFDVTNRSQLILLTFQKVCPVSNVIRLIHKSLDKRRISAGLPPLIDDPLEKMP